MFNKFIGICRLLLVLLLSPNATGSRLSQSRLILLLSIHKNRPKFIFSVTYFTAFLYSSRFPAYNATSFSRLAIIKITLTIVLVRMKSRRKPFFFLWKRRLCTSFDMRIHVHRNVAVNHSFRSFVLSDSDNPTLITRWTILTQIHTSCLTQ